MWQGVVLGTGSEGKPRTVPVLGWCRKTNTVDPRAEKTVVVGWSDKPTSRVLTHGRILMEEERKALGGEEEAPGDKV